MSSFYGIRNTYRPSRLAPNAYAWTTHPGYTQADVPSAFLDNPTDITHDQYQQQFAYEWFQSHQGDVGLSNPPFVGGSAGRLLPMLRDAETGRPARILRGYIRRAGFDDGDDRSRARLYFMYNPEMITRDYVSYLNQSALDPFNTIYGSANDVAPPSFMDFSFSIFFDRQEEAMDPDHPGVFVDYQYFDLVVRNVIPSDPNVSNNTLPDNGVMMVNPRDVTVVFSPQITVQGRPLNANVRFEKFTHRMTPTRMTISMTIRVIYIGPVKEMVEYKAEELQAEASIYLYSAKRDAYEAPESAVERDSTGDQYGQDSSTLPPATKAYMDKTYGIASDGSAAVRQAALDWAVRNVTNSTLYNNVGTGRINLPFSADCSGLIDMAFRGVSVDIAKQIGFYPAASSATMHGLAAQPYNSHLLLQALTTDQKFDWHRDLTPGDILWRDGHVAFFHSYIYPPGSPFATATGFFVFEAAGHEANPQVGKHAVNNGHGRFTHMIRVINVGSTSSIGSSSSWNDNMLKGPV